MYELLKHLVMLKSANQTPQVWERVTNDDETFHEQWAKVTQRVSSASSLDTIDTNK
jgi:hypothetical protein